MKNSKICPKFKNFIKASNEYAVLDKFVPAPYLRRGFTLDFAPEEAKLTIATEGFYELWVNGENITKGFLAPYISNPNQLVAYDEYDLTPYLKKGKNAIGIMLGNGFQNQIITKWYFHQSSFSAPLKVGAALTASGEGKSFSLDTDESFKVHFSPITFDMYRHGVHYDARLEIDGWCDSGFDDSAWENAIIAPAPLGELVKCYAHPIKTRAEISPVSIKAQSDLCYYKTLMFGGKDLEFSRVGNGYLYDFGINTSGVCRLKIKGKRGQRVVLRHSEKLAENGNYNCNAIYFGFNNLHPIESYKNDVHLFQTEVYTLKGGEEEIFTPPFTYHGFRYVFVEGITEEQATKELLTFVAFSSDIKRRADFKCSDEIINTLYGMAVNADLSNFHYFPTDCPHREKNGWTGDASVSADQLHLTFDCADSFKLWLRQMSHTQREDGMLPGVVPTEKYGYEWGNGPMWDSAAINVPYAAYKYDGRVDLFEEIADTLEKYLHYIAGRRDEKGLIACGLGDWVQPGKAKGIPIKSPLSLTDTVTTFDTAKKCALLFDKIGRTDACNYALELADELRAAVRRELIDYETMTAAGDCQTSQVYLIATGIFKPDEYERAYARLLEIIDRDGRMLDTGMIGLRYIFEVLIGGGDIDLALELITNKSEGAPSYYDMIRRGATSLCEALDDGTTNSSENHHFFGDIIRVFTNYIAGLRPNPTLDDINEICFSPVIPTGLDFAEAEYKGAKAGWRREGEKILAYIELPEGMNGYYEHGGKRCSLKVGRNEFIF